MDSPKITYRYYSNPAFCAQSEVVFTQRKPCVTSRVVPSTGLTPEKQRMSPLGANSPRKHEKQTNRRLKTDVSENPLRINKDIPPALPPKPKQLISRQNSTASAYKRQNSFPRATIRLRSRSNDLELSQMSNDLETSRISKHRYEEIEQFEDFDYSPTKKRIVESETDEYNVDGPDENEMKEIPTEIVKTVNGKVHRYAIVPSDDEEITTQPVRNVTFTSPTMSKKNLIATQKLHELLSTPPKRVTNLKSYGSSPNMAKMSARFTSELQNKPIRYSSTPSKSCANLNVSPRARSSQISPKAQQRLEYGTSTINITTNPEFMARSYRSRSPVERVTAGKKFKPRSTAIISPRLVLEQSERYSEDSIYKSWLSIKPSTVTNATLALAAVMLTLCGSLTAGLAFYMMYNVGRIYYLDFGVLSGFTCSLLGFLGFRSRKYQLLPNRNYISGYILVSAFSLMSCLGLLILLVKEPLHGTALHDITGSFICATSVISLLVISAGIIATYCCTHVPADNRVSYY